MVKGLLRVPIGGDSDEYIEMEVDLRDVGEAVQLTADGPDVGTAPFTLASSFGRVMPALSTILTRLRQADHAPDEIAMELGLTVGGETGLIFTKGTAEATFTVSLTWHKSNGGATSPAGSAAV